MIFELQSQTKLVGKVVQVNSRSILILKKRVFSFAGYSPSPLSMLGHNRTITRTTINIFLNIGPGARRRRQKRGKNYCLRKGN